MKQIRILSIFLIISYFSSAQTVSDRLKAAMDKLLAEPATKHASISLYVVNSKTNEVVFDYNSQLGLAPASCQKIFTSIAAFELLGDTFQYKTALGYDGVIKKGVLNGNIYITGYGDPTLGSWRYATTKDTVVLNDWIESIKKLGIKKINGNIILNGKAFSSQPLPGGWPWEDIGNYYGAGCWGLNWYENQYDLMLKPGLKEGDSTTIVVTKPALQIKTLVNQVKTGKKDGGVDATIYLAPYSDVAVASGTIPATGKESVVSGATSNPYHQLAKVLEDRLGQSSIKYKKIINSFDDLAVGDSIAKPDSIFHTYFSPKLDSITYWFLRKSVNLYGEALLKTIAYTKVGEGSTDKGLSVLKQFWQDRGIERSALRIIDGSGLSPNNHVTTNALVTALQYARDKPWFPSFYDALPWYNGMKLKSGTISGIKGFTGYHTSKAGVGYTVAMVVNDYYGASSEMVKNMFLVLEELK